MTDKRRPVFTAITLGVSDMRASIRFYEQFGFVRRMRATGEEVAFFDAGAIMLSLYPSHMLAADADLPQTPPSRAFRGATLACNCRTDAEVDELMAHALRIGARLVKSAHQTSYGGYCGYFADPDDHVWEVVRAPGFKFADDGRLILPD